MPSPLPAFDGDPPQADEFTQEENTGIFPRFCLRRGPEFPRLASALRMAAFSGRKGRGMIAKRTLGFTAAAIVLFLLAGSLAAADRTVLLDIPGCSA